MMSSPVIPSTRSPGERQIYQRRRRAQDDDLHQRQGNLSGMMTLDNAQIGLAATVAVTFTVSSVVFFLRVYARRRLAGWVCSDWLNVLTYGVCLPFWVLVLVGLACGLGKNASSRNDADAKKAASTFFWSQASALCSVGTGRVTSAVLMGKALGRQSAWRLASCMWSCLCGLWVAAEVMLATIGCEYDEMGGIFVCPAERPRWLSITIVDICLEVCLVALWIQILWRLQQVPRTKRLELCAASSSRLLLTPLMGGRFSSYMQFAGNDDENGNSLRATIVLNAILVLLTIVTTNLPVVINMRRKRSDAQQTLGTERGKTETPSVTEQTSPKVDEELCLGHEELGERARSNLPLTLSSDGSGTPRTQPPTIALPQLPRRSIVSVGPISSVRPSQLPSSPPQSPLLPPPQSPSRQPRQHSLRSWPSQSSIAGPWDSRSTYSAHNLVAPLPAWSSLGGN